MKVELLDKIRLVDGREGTVVDVYDDGYYEVEFIDAAGYTDSVETVSKENVASVVWRYAESG